MLLLNALMIGPVWIHDFDSPKQKPVTGSGDWFLSSVSGRTLRSGAAAAGHCFSKPSQCSSPCRISYHRDCCCQAVRRPSCPVEPRCSPASRWPHHTFARHRSRPGRPFTDGSRAHQEPYKAFKASNWLDRTLKTKFALRVPYGACMAPVKEQDTSCPEASRRVGSPSAHYPFPVYNNARSVARPEDEGNPELHTAVPWVKLNRPQGILGQRTLSKAV